MSEYAYTTNEVGYVITNNQGDVLTRDYDGELSFQPLSILTATADAIDYHIHANKEAAQYFLKMAMEIIKNDSNYLTIEEVSLVSTIRREI